MSNDWEMNGLENVANELKDDATFLSGWLPTEPDGRDILRSKNALSTTALWSDEDNAGRAARSHGGAVVGGVPVRRAFAD